MLHGIEMATMVAIMNLHGIDISQDRLVEFCRKWQVTEFALFGCKLGGEQSAWE